MRVYIPATFAMLEELISADERTHARNGWGFAVTDALRGFYCDGDDEELSEIAFDEAARTSLRLLNGYEGKFPLRRVVISADVDAVPQADSGESVVKVSGGAILLNDVAAVHVDVADTEPLVRAAIDSVDAADIGDEDAELTVGDCLDVPLAWYDVAELGALVDLL